jgi:uncharacterized protein (TIGR03083 family)
MSDQRARLDEGLRLIRLESERFYADLDSLAEADWDQPSNCPPWTVRQLVAHQMGGAERYITAIEKALAGEPIPPEPRAARAVRMNEIAAQPPAKIMVDFRALTEVFEAFFGGLSDEQLSVIAPHSHGPRGPVWFVEQRLAEVAFHHWDVNTVLGRPAELATETLRYLLPMLLEMNFPAVLARDKRGGHGSYHLAVRDQPDLAWQLDFAPGAVVVRRGGPSAGSALIEADAAALSLLIIKRHTLAELQAQGRLTFSGDPAMADRFEELFGGP